MELISVVRAKNGWKIEYYDKAKDTSKTPVKIKYPALSDIGLGRPSREFFQAVAKFLRVAIAVGHLDFRWWHERGEVVGVKFREGKIDQLIQVIIEAQTGETINPLVIATPFVEFFSVMPIMQTKDPQAPNLNESVEELNTAVAKYIAGERNVEQMELLPQTLEQTSEKDYATN